MTPEERAAECLHVERGPGGKIDWKANGELIVPDNLEDRIASAIRAAVVEERERCLAWVNRNWTFDSNQQHTHTWHAMADCLEWIQSGKPP